MDDPNNLVNFEQLLKNNNIKPSPLYKTTVNNTTIKPQDVLHSVYSQIKSMQLADGRNSKFVDKTVDKAKSTFLAVSKLPLYNEVPKLLNTFETQCVSDTQLINIIEDAEALIDTHKGMTQEFDTAFTHTNIAHSNSAIPLTQVKIDRDNQPETEEFETTFTQTNVDKTVSFLENEIEKEANADFDQTQIDNKEIDKDVKSMKNVDTLKEMCDKVLEANQCVNTHDTNIETHRKVIGVNENTVPKGTEAENVNKIYIADYTIMLSESMDIDKNEERPPSPILKVKSKTVASPLIVPLDTFEKFERLAIPLIDSDKDFDTCKHLINSQILEGELCLNTDEEVIFNENCQLSPIIGKNCEVIQNNTEESINTNVIDVVNIISRDKRNDSFKDEILFSSDEENDFIYREFQDMPLTAELETSFDKHSDVLEEAIYVGFQTASNKSIKISADSFQKANLILDEDNIINGKDFSLAELVETCDEKSFNNISTASLKVQGKVNLGEKTVEDKSVVNTGCVMTQTKFEENDSKEKMISDDKIKVPKVTDYDDTVKKPPEKQCFVGFKTASNKKIDLSDKAFNHGKVVFKDIDFDDNFDVLDQNYSDTVVEKTKYPSRDRNEINSNKNEPENYIDDKINDDMLIQEFENIEMSLEEKEKSLDENKTDFQCSKTVNNKNIDISDAARVKINAVFQDIDLGKINDKSDDFYLDNKNNAVKQPIPINNEIIIEKEGNSEAAFIGFKTASNKNIEISANALANTKKIFEDIGKDIKKSRDTELKNKNQAGNSRQSTSNSAFLGFKTASNRDIEISEVALSRSSQIFKDIDKENCNDFESEVETAKTLFECFKMASNKNVNTSEQALLNTRKTLQDMIDNNNKTEDSMNISKDNASFSNFKTTSNKIVVISEESIAKSKKLFEDLEAKVTPNTNDNQPSIDEPKSHIPTFKGFQTASTKPVSVSAIAIEKSKKLFQEIDNDETLNKSTALESKGFHTASNKEVTVSKEAPNKKLLDEFKTDNQFFVGFKTANNKKVNISEQALAKCKKLFSDLDDLPTETIENDELEFQAFGFQTANNKQVEVSKNALEKTKKLFKDVAMPEISEMGSFKGFQTASKKKVEVSKEAVEKSKALFNDIGETELKEPFTGFKTANKKKVEVSKDAIEQTKKLFNDFEVLDTKKQDFKGFQTASKKIVNISVDALAKTKQIFKDVDSKLNENVDFIKREEKQNNNGVFSFQTGNNKSINISEEALKESKKLLKNVDGTTNLSENDLRIDKDKILNKKELKEDNTVNLNSILNTQVLNNFEKSLCTEDFNETPKTNKRSASPILSCPRAKKRKRFETPYRDEKHKKVEVVKITDDTNNTCGAKIKFTENYKKNRIYKLKDISNFFNYYKNDPYITNFNLENILDFEFAAQRNEVTNTKMSIDELKNVFLSAVNANLVPEGWLDNHIKLILWKLLSYEVKFCVTLCTVQNVIDQLKYRYDKELYNAERPTLRKIYERDDIPTKTMVLCVAGMYIDGVSVNSVTNTKDVELLLTDGWYFIKASIDKMLTKLVYDRRIVIGCKIITCGAELTNCEQGISPWEDTSAVRLKIFGNSTRPAPWDAILGFSRAAILNQLSNIKVDGGKICRLSAYVTRVYPLLYVEKFEDGSTVTRSERLEHLHQIKYEAERELMMERIYEEVQKEFSDQESQDSEGLDSGKRKCYDSGSQIAKMMKISKDPMEFRAQLTSSQVNLLQEHTCKYRDKVLEVIQNRIQEKISSRNVVTLARGRIASLNSKMELTKGMLSIWKPNDAILELFTEGSWIEVMNTVPTAIRYSEIQITAGRQSVFRPTKCKTEVSPLLQSLKRTCFKISDVTQNPTMTTDYNEIDTVGIVFLIEPNNREFESSRNFQNVYLADADKNMVGVNFWGGLKKFGFENILDTGQVVACANLQKRAGNTGRNIPQFRVTEFTHFTKTPRNGRAREIVDDLDKKLFGLDRRKFCDDCIAIKNNYAAIRYLNNSENESPYRFHKNDYSLTRNKMFIDTPVSVKSNKKEDFNFNLTGLDFESSFKQDTTQLSPRTLLRKKKVSEKIAKLKMYGEPPPLSPINIINKSVNAKKSYKSPLISGNSSDTTSNNLPNSDTISHKLPDESPKTIQRDLNREKSPVISMTRGFVRSVPVKLNFANHNDLVDHFAEEFDGSPPLSLD